MIYREPNSSFAISRVAKPSRHLLISKRNPDSRDQVYLLSAFPRQDSLFAHEREIFLLIEVLPVAPNQTFDSPCGTTARVLVCPSHASPVTSSSLPIVRHAVSSLNLLGNDIPATSFRPVWPCIYFPPSQQRFRVPCASSRHSISAIPGACIIHQQPLHLLVQP